MQKTCIKCGHINPNAMGLDTDSCPKCGVIYAKAQPPLSRTGGRAAAPATVASAWPSHRAPAAPRAAVPSDAYIDRLRAQSHYPAFRTVAGIFAILGYVVAALVLIAAIFASTRGGGAGAGLGGLVFACVIAVFAKVAKEALLMLADLSDATVRMAERQEETAGD